LCVRRAAGSGVAGVFLCVGRAAGSGVADMVPSSRSNLVPSSS
jgi:hypothetical protein